MKAKLTQADQSRSIAPRRGAPSPHRVEIRTAAGPSSVVQWVLRGGPYTVWSHVRQVQALWWAFALGACFGGNGTVIAASANVVAIGIAQRAGHPITSWKFTKYGIVVTVWSAALAWAYVWLRYF